MSATYPSVSHAPAPYVAYQPDPTGKRWRYITVRRLFGRSKVGPEIKAALKTCAPEWQCHLDPTGLRWVWYFRAYLTEQEHADLARRFKAKERKR